MKKKKLRELPTRGKRMDYLAKRDQIHTKKEKNK